MRLFDPKYDSFEVDDHQKAPQFPLYSYLAALLYKVFGLHDWLGRALSAFCCAARECEQRAVWVRRGSRRSLFDWCCR